MKTSFSIAAWGRPMCATPARQGLSFRKLLALRRQPTSNSLNGRHGGKVASTGNKKLTNEQLFAGAEFQIITGAIQFCPDKVPDDVKTKVKEALKKAKAAK